MRRRIVVLLVATLCAVPLILMISGVVSAQSATEDSAGTQSTEKTYIVLYKQEAVPAGSTSQIQAAGGSVVATYGQIGVVIARSDSASFVSTLQRD